MKKYLLIVILFFLLIYLTMPILNYGFYSVGVIVLMLLFVLFLLSLGITTDKAGKKFIVNQKPKKWMLWAIAVVLVYLTVVPFITSATFLHTSKYQKMIGEVKKGRPAKAKVEVVIEKAVKLKRVKAEQNDLVTLERG